MLHLKSPDICCRFGDVLGSMPFLQHPICRIPVGTWLPETGRGSGHHLVVLRQDAPLSSGLDLLLKGTSLSLKSNCTVNELFVPIHLPFHA